MSSRKLVIVITEGLDNERASVAWSIANGGIKSGLEVHVFLTSSAIDWVRKGAADNVHLNPKDPPMIIYARQRMPHLCMPSLCAGTRVRSGRSPGRCNHNRFRGYPQAIPGRSCGSDLLRQTNRNKRPLPLRQWPFLCS